MVARKPPGSDRTGQTDLFCIYCQFSPQSRAWVYCPLCGDALIEIDEDGEQIVPE